MKQLTFKSDIKTPIDKRTVERKVFINRVKEIPVNFTFKESEYGLFAFIHYNKIKQLKQFSLN